MRERLQWTQSLRDYNCFRASTSWACDCRSRWWQPLRCSATCDLPLRCSRRCLHLRHRRRQGRDGGERLTDSSGRGFVNVSAWRSRASSFSRLFSRVAEWPLFIPPFALCRPQLCSARLCPRCAAQQRCVMALCLWSRSADARTRRRAPPCAHASSSPRLQAGLALALTRKRPPRWPWFAGSAGTRRERGVHGATSAAPDAAVTRPQLRVQRRGRLPAFAQFIQVPSTLRTSRSPVL